MPFSVRQALLSWTLLSILAGAAWAAKPRSPTTPPPTKNEAYSVIQVGQEVKVVKKSEVKAEEKSVKDRYQRDMKAYQEAKKSAGKNKDAASQAVKPDKANYVFKILKASCKTKDEADDYAAKHQDGKTDKTSKTDSAKTGKKDSPNW